MLKKTPTAGQTVSIVHQNVAQYHYNLAFQAWDVACHCLNDKGLCHPDFVKTHKSSLSEFRKHVAIGDTLMRRLGGGWPIQSKPKPSDYRLFADDFELALIQRGNNAKKEAGYG